MTATLTLVESTTDASEAQVTVTVNITYAGENEYAMGNSRHWALIEARRIFDALVVRPQEVKA